MLPRPLLLLLIPLLTVASSTFGGEWRAAGPDGGTVTVIAASASEPMLIAATAEGLLFRSTDGAHTWERAGAGLSGHQILQVVIHPRDAAVVWVSTEAGLFRSVDRGTSFTLRQAGYVKSFAVAPSNPSVLYTSIANGGLLIMSRDGGVTWTSPANAGLVAVPTSLAVDAVDPSVVYAVALDTPFDIDYLTSSLLLRSRDAGATWQTTTVLPQVLTVVAHPTIGGVAVATRIVTGIAGLPFPVAAFGTTDGTNWTALHTSDNGLVVFDPNVAGRVYFGDFGVSGAVGQVDRSDDNGAVVQRLTTSPQLTSLVVDPANSNTLYAGVPDNGVMRSDDAGQTWTILNRHLAAAEMNWLAADPHEPDVFYAGGDAALFRSGDHGASWQAILPTAGGTSASEPESPSHLVVDPGDSTRLWVTSGVTLWHSGDTGATWQQVAAFPGSRLLDSNVSVTGLAIDPHDAKRIWVALSDQFPGFDPGELYTSSDGGQTFSFVATPTSRDLLRQLVADPVTRGNVWISGERLGGPLLAFSTDGGQSWTDLSGRLGTEPRPVTALLVDHSSIFAALSGPRLLRSDDGGQTWRDSGPSLEAAASAVSTQPAVSSMILLGGYLYASVAGFSNLDKPSTGGIFVSGDGGTSWADISGATAHSVVSQLISSDPIIATTVGAGIFVGQGPFLVGPGRARIVRP